MSWEKNIYYNPEKFGLTTFAEIELSEPFYSFDTVLIQRDEQGDWFVNHDSGCSCPSPFEDLDSPGEPLTARGAVARIRSLVDDSYEKEYASQAASEVIGRILSA